MKEEEMEETTLEGRESSQPFKDNKMNTNVMASTSSFDPEMNYIISEHKHQCTDQEVKDATTNVGTINITSFDNEEDIQNTPFNDVNNQCKETVKDEGPLEDFDQRLRELDVEVVLAKQETHDLFCPNCKSCITKKVILKKRKRRGQDLDPNAKRDKFDNVVGSKMVDNSVYEANRSDEALITNTNREVPPADSDGHEREPEVFRCLSCFRYFIPTRNSFSLFRKFPGTCQQESLLDSSSLPAFDSPGSSSIPVTDEKNLSNIPVSSSNWFLSLFSYNKWRTSGDIIIHGRDISATTITSEAAVKDEEHAKDTAPKSYEEEAEISEKDIYNKSSIATEDKLNLQDSYHPSSMEGSQVPSQSFLSAEFAKNATSSIQSICGDNEYLPEQDLTLVEEAKPEIEEEINPLIETEKKGGEVIVLVEPVECTTIQTEDSVSIEGTMLTETSTQAEVQNGEQAGGEVDKPYGLELLKCIVYGGLTESIASLGIVTSAASAGASSSNIIAVGFAKVIGGLFIIVHHLMELKEEEDRYQRLLGHPENILLHAVLAILSGLIFGAVPIIIYGILIGVNNSSEVTVIEVVAVSLVFIILLVIGKVYTKRPPKSYLKTMLYILALTVATSGMSYGVGKLIKDLIVRLNWLDSGLAIHMPISSSSERKASWTSY